MNHMIKTPISQENRSTYSVKFVILKAKLACTAYREKYLILLLFFNKYIFIQMPKANQC